MTRVLLDENLPRPLVRAKFDVLLTGDKNLRHQQNLSDLPIGIVLVGGYSTKLEDLVD